MADAREASDASRSGLIELSDWIAALRVELETAQTEGAGKSLQFVVGPIELEFELTVTREGEGRGAVRFWVIELGAGGSRASGATQRVKLTLTPRSPTGDLAVGDRLPGMR